MKNNEKHKQSWKQNPEGVQQDILRVATEMFAEHGLSGTRIDEIAARTKTSKRMIYYYFGDKVGLYTRVLQEAYANVRKGERDLDLDGLPADEALRALIGFTFDHHRRNPDFIRLVMIENIHHADFLRQTEVIKSLNSGAIDQLCRIVKRGQSAGLFKADIDAVALHWQISGLAFFNVSNRPTFSSIFGGDLFTDSAQDRLKQEFAEMVLGHIRA